MRPRTEEEDYERPFADVRNAWKMTPDWTPERIDEWAVQQKRASTWVRQSQDGKFLPDPYENLDLALDQRIFSLISTALFASSFGKSTPAFLELLDSSLGQGAEELFSAVQVPAAILGLLAVGSSIVCATQAPEKNRSRFIWLVKGLFGGPFACQPIRRRS